MDSLRLIEPVKRCLCSANCCINDCGEKLIPSDQEIKTIKEDNKEMVQII